MPETRLKRTLLLFSAAVAVTAFLWLVLTPPKGGPILPGAYRGPEGYAVLPPAGWKLEILPPSQGEFLLLARMSPEDGTPGAAGVALTGRDLPEPDPVEFLPFINAVLPGAIDKSLVGGITKSELDGLPSLRVEGTGTKGGEELFYALHAVRGAEKTFVVGIAAPHGPLQGPFQASFRVLDRPYSPRHLFRTAEGEIRKEILWALLALVFACYKWIFSGLFKE